MAKRNIEETWQNLMGLATLFLLIIIIVVIIGGALGWL